MCIENTKLVDKRFHTIANNVTDSIAKQFALTGTSSAGATFNEQVNAIHKDLNSLSSSDVSVYGTKTFATGWPKITATFPTEENPSPRIATIGKVN